MDFWVGSAMLVVLALFEVILFGWVFGAERGIDEANRASDFHVPRFFAFVIRWVCPIYLVFILGGFAVQSFPAQVRAVGSEPAALLTALFMGLVLTLLVALVVVASRRWERDGRFRAPADARAP